MLSQQEYLSCSSSSLHSIKCLQQQGLKGHCSPQHLVLTIVGNKILKVQDRDLPAAAAAAAAAAARLLGPPAAAAAAAAAEPVPSRAAAAAAAAAAACSLFPLKMPLFVKPVLLGRPLKNELTKSVEVWSPKEEPSSLRPVAPDKSSMI